MVIMSDSIVAIFRPRYKRQIVANNRFLPKREQN